MRIVDAGVQTTQKIKLIRDFKAREISDLPFGWNVPNWLSSNLKRGFGCKR